MMTPNTRTLLLALAVATATAVAARGAHAGGNLLSAGWGLDDALPAFPDCPESLGRDGLPVVLDAEVDNQTLDAADFEVELASGARRTPICATLLPAQEENEDRTVLLIGDLGSLSDPPRWVRVVGELRGEDGSVLGGAVAVPAFESGPSLVMAEPAAIEQTECPQGTAAAIRLIFSGGVLSTDGDEFAAADLERFSIATLAGVVTPIAFSDLNDFDNNLELCLATAAVALRATVAGATVIDPNGDANVESSVDVDRPEDALELNGVWYDPATPGEGFTVTQGRQGTVSFYYGYDAFGERLWLISDVIRTHFYAGASVSVDMYLGQAGTFALPGSAVSPWGTMTITAESCESVRFELSGIDGVKRLQGVRLADGGRDCEDAVDVPFAELYAQGVDRYLGAFTPSSAASPGAGVTSFRFSEQPAGPLCYTGNEYTMSTRDGPSDELMIFLMGGGVCGPQGCAAIDTPTPILQFGIMDPANPTNPAAGFDVGWIPYCDGTLFSGDRDVDSDGDGSNDRFFRGVQNLSAALDVIKRTYPAPERIVLAGISAGGAGVHYALPLVRKLYPDVPIELINDSGVGILTPGGQALLNDYWNAGAAFPASCADCIGEDGNLTGYHRYQLEQDDNLRMGFMSFSQDGVVANESLMISGPAFEAELLQAMDELQVAAPDRFRSFIATGTDHTFIIRTFDVTAGGISARQWVTDMLSGSEDWVSRRD
jgi:hypothetical protein